MVTTRLGYDGNEVLENVFPVSRIVLHNYFEEISYRKFVFLEERYFWFNFLTSTIRTIKFFFALTFQNRLTLTCNFFNKPIFSEAFF